MLEKRVLTAMVLASPDPALCTLLSKLIIVKELQYQNHNIYIKTLSEFSVWARLPIRPRPVAAQVGTPYQGVLE